MLELKKREIMSGNRAVAEAVKLCNVKVIAAYPITPQTPIVEYIAEFIANGELDAEYIKVESEHSALSACIGASATGVRTFTATSSQGLMYMYEVLFIASGLRLPIVMAVVNRAISAPINIWNDWQDAMVCRDSGWIMFFVENNQEAFDFTILSYKIAEDRNVLLPVMINMDGFILSHTYEPIEIYDKSLVEEFLPKEPDIPHKLDISNPLTLGHLATPEYYMEFKFEQEEALQRSNDVIKNHMKEFNKIFERDYKTVEVLGDGDITIVTMGSLAGSLKYLLNKKRNFKLVNIKQYRPFPKQELLKALEDSKTIGVIEKDVSYGLEGGVLYNEIKSIIQGKLDARVISFITGLGGRDTRIEDLEKMLELCKNPKRNVYWLGLRRI